jgi:hypothetical protein
MPIYEYKCLSCGTTKEVKGNIKEGPKPFLDIFAHALPVNAESDIGDPRIVNCVGILKLQVSLPAQPNYGFKPYVTENITGEPVLLTSRKHKKELCKKYGVRQVG